ncbi:hypothetical protein BOX15_Mlig016037g1 [Macrostomum lignano]|nr:hypothetical protein BOX15_Mlig016037g2 [Macrostomum lignano]PAA72953.1 hypothetical protein BOX15_Mlig016037g1 [Macrostomum lignano]
MQTSQFRYSMLPIISRLLLVSILTILLSIAPAHCDATTSEAVKSINTFEYNWAEVEKKNSKGVEFSLPSTKDSKFDWTPGSFGPCFGCGTRSYRYVSHDCVHRLPINLTADAVSKTLVGVFKVPEEECTRRKGGPPAQRTLLGCGPPCSQLRLLRGGLTGCRCLHERKLAFDVPRLTCQDTRNRSVSLSLCQTIYEKSTRLYTAAPCEFDAVCSQPSEWVVGNWTLCSVDSPQYQNREVVCATRVPNGVYLIMHDSMCVKAARPVANRYCARWAAEKNFKCKCSDYIARRIVICMRGRRGSRKPVPEFNCNWHDKPLAMRYCTESERSECRRRR